MANGQQANWFAKTAIGLLVTLIGGSACTGFGAWLNMSIENRIDVGSQVKRLDANDKRWENLGEWMHKVDRRLEEIKKSIDSSGR